MHVMNEQHENAVETMPTAEQLVARQLRLLRQGRGWSQQEVAEKMRAYGYRWSQATVTRLESASRPIRLAILYGIPVAQFLQSDVPEFEWDDLGALEREITNLTAQRDGLRERMEAADAAASSLERERAEAAAYIARIDGRLEALTRWHPQAARLSADQLKAVAVSEPAQP
jgi:transcriptional regulator with XRE-family HTH domain